MEKGKLFDTDCLLSLFRPPATSATSLVLIALPAWDSPLTSGLEGPTAQLLT